MPAKICLSGRVFGRLKVESETTPSKTKSGRRIIRYFCRCDCGNHTIIRGESLKSGNTISRGCFHRQQLALRNTKHGQAKTGKKTPIYEIWSQMIGRCTNPLNGAWKNYGGRGIRVCAKWMEFSNFFEDMGNPTKGMSIDRIDNDGDYSPSNCRWSTRKEQNRNQRKNRIFTVFGITGCAAKLGEHFRIKPHVALARIRNGWDPADAFITPIASRYQKPFN